MYLDLLEQRIRQGDLTDEQRRALALLVDTISGLGDEYNDADEHHQAAAWRVMFWKFERFVATIEGTDPPLTYARNKAHNAALNAAEPST